MLNGLSREQVEMGSIVFSNLDRAIDDPIINPMRSNVKCTAECGLYSNKEIFLNELISNGNTLEFLLITIH